MTENHFFLYIIGPDEGFQKIGFSKNVQKRLKTLQTGNPLSLKIHHTEPVPENRIRLLEKKIHQELKHHRLEGEWFDISPDDAKWMLKFSIIRWIDDYTLFR